VGFFLPSPTSHDWKSQIVISNKERMGLHNRMRELLLTHKDILVKLEQIEKNLLKQDARINKHEEDIQTIFEALKQLLNPPAEPRLRVGFRRKDEQD
jgi:hypothetical protein